MNTMVGLTQSEHQGITVLLAILQFVFAAAQYPGSDGSRTSGIPERIISSMLLLVVGWVIYSIPWALLAFSMGFSPSMVVSPLYFVLGAFAVIGAITTKAPIIGGIIGGSVPLATLSLFFVSLNPQMLAVAPPLAWFAMFMLFGGLLGALTGPAAIAVMDAVKARLMVRSLQRGLRNQQDDDRATAFDAFLSHNSRDKPTVRIVARALESRGLRVWLDEEQLVPGRSWQEEVEKIIRTTHAAVVLVGQDGLGPWEIPEMRACLSQFVRRKMPVIPVLLPNAPGRPELPLFLQEITWVDLSGGLSEENLDRLEWGITGTKPRQAVGR